MVECTRYLPPDVMSSSGDSPVPPVIYSLSNQGYKKVLCEFQVVIYSSSSHVSCHVIVPVRLYHEHAHLCNQLVFDGFHLDKRHHKESEALVFPDSRSVCYHDHTVMDGLFVGMVNVELEYVETALGVALGNHLEVEVHLFGWTAYHGDCEAYRKAHHRDLKANRVDFLGYPVMLGTLKALLVALGMAQVELGVESLKARRVFFEVREEQVTCVLGLGLFEPQPPYLRGSRAVTPPGKSAGRHSDFRFRLVSCCPGNNKKILWITNMATKEKRSIVKSEHMK